METPYDIEQYFLHRNLNDNSRFYLKFHSKRYFYLLKLIDEIRSFVSGRSIKIMDIGPSFFTEVIARRFPEDSILTLGFDYNESRGWHLPLSIKYDQDSFFSFDLNNSQYPEKWIQVPMCDIIVMAEVIEHLYTAPTLVLNFIKSFLNNGGYLIIYNTDT